MMYKLIHLVFCFLLSPSEVDSICGDIVEPNKGEEFNHLFLYPLTVSKNNDSYNMPMILKAIAYRKLEKADRHVIIADFCNDQIILIEILLKFLFNKNVNYLTSSVTIHADIEDLRIAKLILDDFSMNPTYFINNFDAKSFYRVRSSEVYYETNFGFMVTGY